LSKEVNISPFFFFAMTYPPFAVDPADITTAWKECKKEYEMR
jgi:hypothetical protein